MFFVAVKCAVTRGFGRARSSPDVFLGMLLYIYFFVSTGSDGLTPTLQYQANAGEAAA